MNSTKEERYDIEDSQEFVFAEEENDRRDMQGAAGIGKGKKKKKHVVRYALMTCVYLTLAIFVVALGTALYTWVEKRLDQGSTPPAATLPAASESGEQEAVSDRVVNEEIFTKEQVDTLLSEAATREEESVLQAGIEGRNDVLAQIRAGLENGDSTLETIRPLYPEYLVVVVTGGFYKFVPIDHTLQKNLYVSENVEVLESGEFRYLENGEVISHKGIDVSSHQGKIDWQSVAADGVEFAFVRMGLRGYGSGKLVEDEQGVTNVKGAMDAGIHVGLYVFSQAVNEEEVLEEAQLLLDKAGELGVTGPLVIDVERVSDETGRMNLISVEERTNLIRLFCETVKNAGYKPLLYQNTELGALMVNLSELEEYEKWYASYSDKIFYPYRYGIWQYSAKGTVSGIKGNVDMNISFSKFWE